LLTSGVGRTPGPKLGLDPVFARVRDGRFRLDGGAEGLLHQARALDPEDVDVRLLLAVRLEEAGRTELAVAELDTAVERNPDCLPARYDRAWLRRKLGHIEAEHDVAFLVAHPRFEDLLRESSDAIRAFHFTSRSLLREGRVAEAVQAARRGLD